MSSPAAARGLEGVVVADSSICRIDGERGELSYRGYPIGELATSDQAGEAGFEEVAHLLWFGKLPCRRELADLSDALRDARPLPAGVLDHLRSLPRGSSPMDVVRTLASVLASYDREAADPGPEAALRKSIRVTSALATGLAAFHRLREQLSAVEPRPELGHAANFLWMLSGEAPSAAAARAFDAALILHMEHGFNASTFAARVVASTLSDLHSAVTGAIATLKGPLHGGANERVMDMLLEIGRPERAAPWVSRRLQGKGKIMGFGHRVYRTVDPRATVLKHLAGQLTANSEMASIFAVSRAVEEAVASELEGKGIAPNVDFYSASLYHGLGIPRDVFTPVFAIARVVGWTAHVLEQYADNRLIRPKSRYVGPDGLRYVPLEARS